MIKRLLGAGGLALAFGAMALWWSQRAGDGGAGPIRGGSPEARTSAPPRITSDQPQPSDDADEATDLDELPEIEPPSPEQARAHSLGQLENSLQIYQQFAVYPPWSRPYGENMRHLVEWNRLRPEGQPFAVDDERRELSVEVSLDRMFAAPGEAVNALVRLGRRDGGALLPANFDEVTARIEWNEPGKGYSVAEVLTLARQGTDYTVSFVPNQIAALAVAQREAMFTVKVVRREFFKEIRMPFQYAVKTAFQVLGIAGERIVHGSLVVDLDVDATHATPTLIQAVLYDKSGTNPIAVYDDYFRPTAPGRQIASITFFGKVLRDKNAVGPYSIRALHGVSRDPGADPPEVFWKRDDAPPLLTRRYYPSQFSDAEWSSPEKDEKIAQYRRLIAAGGL